MTNGNLFIDTSNEFPVFAFTGYCTDESIKNLNSELKTLHANGHAKFIFDFSDCMIINSVGMAELLDAILVIDQDYAGFTILTHLDSMKETLFTVSGIIPICKVAKDNAEAMSILKTL